MRRSPLQIVCIALLAAVLVPAIAGASDKPRIAIIEFENKADNQYWWRGGGEALQDKFVTALVKSGKFRVIEREKLDALMREKGLVMSGDIDASTASRIGKILGLNYMLTGSVTEYGVEDAGGRTPTFGGRVPSISAKRRKFTAAVDARLIDVETAEIVWAEDAEAEEKSGRLFVGGVGGGVDDKRMFDKVMEPIIGELVASLKAADI